MMARVQPTGSVERPAELSQRSSARSVHARRVPSRENLIVLVVLGLAFVANVVWRLWLVRDVTALTVRVDEDNYLVAARVLSGGPGGASSENSLFRRIGYPLLISPVYWFSQDPLTTYKGVLGLNAVLNSLTLVPAYLFARRVLGIGRWLAAVSAVAVTAMPAVAFYAQVAMTDAVLPMLLLWWLLAVHVAVAATGGSRRAIGAGLTGLTAGLIWFVHVRGLVVLIVEVALLASLAWRHRSWRPPALVGLAGIAIVLTVELVIRELIRGQIIVTGGSPAGTMLERLTSPAGWLHITAWAVGQLWYLAIATLGLAAVAGCGVLRWLRGHQREHRARNVNVAMLIVTTLGIALLSAATLPDDARINLYAYARYLAFLVPAWVLVGVAALTELVRGRETLRSNARLVGFAVIAIAVSAASVQLYSRRLTTRAYIAFDSPEVGAMTGQWDGLPVISASLVAVVGLLVLAGLLLGRRLRYVALALVAVLGLAALPTMSNHATRPMAAAFAANTTLAEAGVTPADRVSEGLGVPWWVQANHQWEVSWQRISIFEEEKVTPPADATVVIAPYRSSNGVPDWDGSSLGWRMVHQDAQGWAMWRR